MTQRLAINPDHEAVHAIREILFQTGATEVHEFAGGKVRIIGARVDELLVAAGARAVFHQGYGFADLATRRPVTLDTVFDLASLTKPLATTLAVARLSEVSTSPSMSRE